MRRLALHYLVAWSVLVLASCGDGASYTLRIAFPDEASRLDTARLYLWALGPDAGTCDELVKSGVDPAGVTVYASLVLDNPPGAPEVLPSVPNGVVLFLVEGRTASDAKILRGCAREEMKDDAKLDVRIVLVRICTPGLEEIPGNQIDDDCDGDTDECTRDLDCRDEDTCTLDLCVEEECHHLPAGASIRCNDGDPCTVEDSCQEDPPGVWVCRGTPKDCAFGDACSEGICDAKNGQCDTRSKDDGETCDDGLYCTVGETCQAGECTGAARDCDDYIDCTRDECNEGQDRCDHSLEPKPGAEGPMGDATCADGVDNDCDDITDDQDPNCQGCAVDPDCDDGNPCTTDSCVSPNCVNTPVTEGTPCDDGMFCTVRNECFVGVCLGELRDCSGPETGPCLESVCVEEQDICEDRPLEEGAECDDGDWCTVRDQCQQSVSMCWGEPRDCEDGDVCTWEQCNSQTQQCEIVGYGGGSPEGPEGNPTCWNGVDDDCDGLTDWCDVECGYVPDCAGIQCGYDWCNVTWCSDCPWENESCFMPARQCVPGYWVYVDPPDPFFMGSDTAEPGRNPDETRHEVQLTQSFMIWSAEVAQEFFSLVMRYNPATVACDSGCPVENLTWHEAANFCNWMSEAEGYRACYACQGNFPDVECELDPDWTTPYECPGYRLPTEAEWEYAARAGSHESTYNGTIPTNLLGCEQPNYVLDPIAWFCGNSDSGNSYATVMAAQPNSWGLYDMLGNLSEWCHDGYGDYSSHAPVDPLVPPDGDKFVVRGGSWVSPASSCRSACRDTREYYEKSGEVGFRPVRSLIRDW